MAPYRILIINPNSNALMTESLRAPIESLGYNDTTYTYHTAPSPSPPSINDLETASTSSTITLPSILPLVHNYDAFLVACYSPHPLVSALKARTSKPVLGIFEASVSAAIALLGNNEKFGIVSTGEVWKEILSTAMRDEVLGAQKLDEVFAGVETLGVNAGDLHAEGGEEAVKEKVQAATKRLLEKRKGQISMVILGCAGMAGMEEWVREAAKGGDIQPTEYTEGNLAPKTVKVVDGVRAGVGILQGLVRGGF